MRRVVVLAEAAEDLEEARKFYDARAAGVGDYCVTSLLADIESLAWYHGIHWRQHGCFRMLPTGSPLASKIWRPSTRPGGGGAGPAPPSELDSGKGQAKAVNRLTIGSFGASNGSVLTFAFHRPAYQEQETVWEDVVVKPGGWFRKAVTERVKKTVTVTRHRTVRRVFSEKRRTVVNGFGESLADSTRCTMV